MSYHVLHTIYCKYCIYHCSVSVFASRTLAWSQSSFSFFFLLSMRRHWHGVLCLRSATGTGKTQCPVDGSVVVARPSFRVTIPETICKFCAMFHTFATNLSKILSTFVYFCLLNNEILLSLCEILNILGMFFC